MLYKTALRVGVWVKNRRGKMVKNEGIVVLSLFDGMSCGQIALREQGIVVKKYYASEVDKYAIQQTQHNFPDTIQLGSVTEVKAKYLPKIDLLIGGSPCQGFSFAGKQLNFKDPRSALFFEYVRIWNEIKEINPDAKFLLENVNMKKEHLRVISQFLGVFPVRINSNLVSAQNRDRWYWTNIRTKKVGLFGELYSDIPQPKDEGILLRDILEDEVDEKYYISNAVLNRVSRKEYSQPQFNPDKTGALSTKNNSGQMSLDSGTTFITVLDITGKPKPNQNKSACFTAGGNSGGNHSDMDLICVAMRGREDAILTPKRTDYGKEIRKDYEAGKITEQRKNIQQLEPRTDGKTNTITGVQKDNLVMTKNYLQLKDNGFDSDNRFFYENEKHGSVLTKGEVKTGVVLEDKNKMVIVGNVYESSGQAGKVVDTEYKSPPITGQRVNSQGFLNTSRIRRLTPTECARLQTIPDWYKWIVSDTQQYKLLGNGWTIKVIKHIISFLNMGL